MYSAVRFMARQEVRKDGQIDKLMVEVKAMKGREEMCSKAEEKCRLLEAEMGKLEMDLKAASGIGEEEVKMRKAAEAENKSLYAKITNLFNKLEEAEDKGNGDLQSSAQKKDENMMVQRIAVLEKEKGEMEAQVKKLEREKHTLEQEYMHWIEVITVLVQEKECLADKLKKLKMEINKLAENAKSEDNAELPQNNVCILGKKSAKRTRPRI